MNRELPPIEHCRSCGADIYWLRNRSTGKMAPINVEPMHDGNCVVNLPDHSYLVLKKGTHISHFVTCPQRKMWRGK